jgi:hypothetical protein
MPGGVGGTAVMSRLPTRLATDEIRGLVNLLKACHRQIFIKAFSFLARNIRVDFGDAMYTIQHRAQNKLNDGHDPDF